MDIGERQGAESYTKVSSEVTSLILSPGLFVPWPILRTGEYKKSRERMRRNTGVKDHGVWQISDAMKKRKRG